MALGKMEKVDLRNEWRHEAHDFTKWLAEDDSLAMLSEAIGVDLELLETESSVGAFNVDLFAQEAGTGRRVVVENQLEDTDHDHLGKAITYAAGKEASVVVWVVARARDEHRRAIEWLNQHTDSEFGFFLVEVELWRIDGSRPAAKFNVVERPNDWAKQVKLKEGLGDTARLQLEYWTRYNELARKNPNFMKRMKPQKAQPQHWTNIAIGSSAYHVVLSVKVQKKCVSAELYIDDDKLLWAKVVEEKGLFERRVDMPAELFEGKKAAGIRFTREGVDVKASAGIWDEMIEWQLGVAVVIKDVVAELAL